MDKKEFNKYLVDSQQTIMNLYYRRGADGKIVLDDNGNPINDYLQASAERMDINEGWYQLIHDLLEELLKTDWNRDLHQVKEKFGGLRFYVGEASQEVREIIARYENLSYETCEACGEKGELRTDIGWRRTLCEKHYQVKLSEIRSKETL